MLKAAMDEAQAKAMQEKYQRKMQHLEKGGHDTSKLRENLEGNCVFHCFHITCGFPNLSFSMS